MNSAEGGDTKVRKLHLFLREFLERSVSISIAVVPECYDCVVLDEFHPRGCFHQTPVVLYVSMRIK